MESDDEAELDTIVILPPDHGEVTDEELEIDGTNPVIPHDVSGKLEAKSSSKGRNKQESTILKVHDLTTKKTPNKGKQRHSKNCSKPNERREPNEKKHWPKRNWGSSDKKFVEMQRRPAMSCLQDQYPDLASKSPLEIYKLFFDREIEDLIIHHTMKYAREVHNDHEFVFERDDLWKFLIIIPISSYNERPSY